jgi:transposase-like protein
MGAPRKHPPKDAAEIIQQLAATGYAIIGIAKALNVAKETFKRWLDENESLHEAFEAGREIERQALHASVYRSAMEGKPANVNAFFLLKARHGYVETDNRTKVNLDVQVAAHVLVVKGHGSDEEWAAKAAEQQRRLTLDTPKPEAALAPPLTVPAAPPPPSQQRYDAPTWRGNA